jgi:hypothetical protein
MRALWDSFQRGDWKAGDRPGAVVAPQRPDIGGRDDDPHVAASRWEGALQQLTADPRRLVGRTDEEL